jgi:Fe-S oxidoreductase
MTYKEQLRDPRWQRIQSSVRERDNYRCQCCGDTSSFLHVHHLYYQKNLKAWEYDKESLVTVCESCHAALHTSIPKIISLMVIQIVKDGSCIMDIELAVRRITKTEHTRKIPF